MPKARKRATPVTTTAAGPSNFRARDTPSTAPASSKTRAVIRRFHVLLKRQAHLSQLVVTHGNERKALEEVEREIESLGGLPAYQRMSIAGQSTPRGGGSEKVLIGWLKELGLDATQGEKGKGKEGCKKLRVLEVGALKPDNYAACIEWMEVTPIDLHSQHPDILEQDFLLMDEEEHHAKWDIISLSLVVNFVPDAKDRGNMLRMAHDFIRPGGHLFLALPLPCVSNSRYLTFEHLHALMEYLGFTELKKRWKPGGKMAYWLYQRDEPQHATSHSFGKKAVLRTGNRNNFCILLS